MVSGGAGAGRAAGGGVPYYLRDGLKPGGGGFLLPVGLQQAKRGRLSSVARKEAEEV